MKNSALYFFLIILLLLSLIPVETRAQASWYDTAWQYRRQISSNNLQIPADMPDGGETGFPIDLIIDPVNGINDPTGDMATTLFDNIQTNGEDILITDSDGTTKLAHGIKRLVTTDGSEYLALAFLAPSISSSQATDFYLYYDNATCIDQQQETAVYPTADGWQGVWSLEEVMGKTDSLDDLTMLEPYDADPVVIPRGDPGDWDEDIREIGNILYEPNASDPSKKYKAFYTGHQGGYAHINVYIGYAYSPDGINFTKYPGGSVIPGYSLEDPYVVKVGDTYYLYVEDKGGSRVDIRRYHSSDCETWIDDGVVFQPQAGGDPPDWESANVASPAIWVEDGIWYLFYEGLEPSAKGRIGLATSTDGLNWTRDPANPVIDAGEPGEWDDWTVVSDDIMKIGRKYYQTYHGGGVMTGLLTSYDLRNWERYKHNPFTGGTDSSMFFYDTEYVFFHVAGVSYHGPIGRYYPWINKFDDLTANGNHGVEYLSDTGKDGQVGSGQEFDGSDDLIEMPYSASLDSTDMTVQLWAKMGSTNEDRRFISRHGDWQMFIDLDGHLAFYIYDGSWQLIDSGYTPPPDEWVHLGFVLDGSSGTFRIWTNGSLGPDQGSFSVDTGGFIRIARYHDSPRFYGFLDEVSYSDEPRSEDWIGAIYNSQNDNNGFWTMGFQESPGNGNGNGVIHEGELPDTGSTQTLLAILGLATIPILSLHLGFLIAKRNKQ